MYESLSSLQLARPVRELIVPATRSLGIAHSICALLPWQYNLSGVTVLTIAHRLNTIMHYDRVAVILSGQVAEIGPPHELKEKPGTLFSELWQQVA